MTITTAITAFWLQNWGYSKLQRCIEMQSDRPKYNSYSHFQKLSFYSNIVKINELTCEYMNMYNEFFGEKLNKLGLCVFDTLQSYWTQ